jgi:hypothetical protein
MRRSLIAAGVFALVMLAALAGTQARTRAATDPAAVAAHFGVPGKAWPFKPKDLDDQRFRFAVHDRGDKKPCIAYKVPGHDGGACFVAVGSGGWALEANFVSTDQEPLVIGAAVPAARTVRLGTARSIALGPISKRFGVRFFAARVSDAAATTRPNGIVALDAGGRLLGRQHYNDGHGGFGARDGRWEKAFDRRNHP